MSLIAESFTEKKIQLKVQLIPNPPLNQPGKFNETGTNTVILADSRTTVRISNAGAPAGSTAIAEIYGLTPSLMNQMSTLGMVFNIQPFNILTISAGDVENGLSTVFSGVINIAYGDFNRAPDVPFHFEANGTLQAALAPAVPASFQGATDAATVMQGFASKLGLGFENNGVAIQVPSSYHSGNIRDQIQSYAEAAHINAEIVDAGTTLAIWPIGGSRNTQTIPLISKATGMIGYPTYTEQGLLIKTLFRPQIKFGGLVRVQSSLPRANGTWAVNTMDLALDEQMPGGQWMQSINAWNPKYPRPVQQPAS